MEVSPFCADRWRGKVLSPKRRHPSVYEHYWRISGHGKLIKKNYFRLTLSVVIACGELYRQYLCDNDNKGRKTQRRRKRKKKCDKFYWWKLSPCLFSWAAKIMMCRSRPSWRKLGQTCTWRARPMWHIETHLTKWKYSTTHPACSSQACPSVSL